MTLHTARPAEAATANALLALRRGLACAPFLREYLYTQDDSRFLGSIYKYGTRLSVSANPSALLNRICDGLSESARQLLCDWVERLLLPTLPGEFVTVVDVPPSVSPEDAGDESRTRAEQAIAHELPASIPYARYYWELTRAARRCDPACSASPTNEEFSALFGHGNRQSVSKARARFPALWDEQRGHYVLDTRGTRFATAFTGELRNRGLLHPGTRFLDLGSGVGTMVAAVHYFSDAHATGVEQHRGLTQLARVLLRRLSRLRPLDPQRIALKTGNAFHPEVIDLSRFDLCYVYSPIGSWELSADAVLDRLRVGAVLVANRRPRRHFDRVERLADVEGTGVYRKTGA